MRSPNLDEGTYLILLESCEVVSPGFKAATNSVNERWRRENAAAIAAVETSAKFKADLAAVLQRVKTLGSKDLEELKDMCGQIRHGLEVRPRDARLATPTKTWELFLASLQAADRTTALGCLTAAARHQYKAIASLTDDGLRQMGNDFAKFGLTHSFRQGDEEVFTAAHDGRSYLIYFEEYNGEWRISGF